MLNNVSPVLVSITGAGFPGFWWSQLYENEHRSEKPLPRAEASFFWQFVKAPFDAVPSEKSYV